MIIGSDVRYVTVDGVNVGWDMCGDCHRHLRRCDCESGPVAPAYLSGDRTTAPAAQDVADVA